MIYNCPENVELKYITIRNYRAISLETESDKDKLIVLKYAGLAAIIS